MTGAIIIAANHSTLSNLIATPQLVVIFFSASWCESCKLLEQVIQAHLSTDQSSSVKFVKVEAEDADDITQAYSIAFVPTCVFLKNGTEVDRLEGYDPEALSSKLGHHSKEASSAAAAARAAATSTVPAVDPLAQVKAVLASSPVVVFTDAASDASKQLVELLEQQRASSRHLDVSASGAYSSWREAVLTLSGGASFPLLFVNQKLVPAADTQGDALKAALAAAQQLPASSEHAPPPHHAHAHHHTPAAAPAAAAAAEDRDTTFKRIDALLHDEAYPVVLFMKGTPGAYRCGFSRKVGEALADVGVTFKAFDILADEDVRQRLKEYSEWPTYPQLYVKGELLGGCDIVLQMRDQGSLKAAIDEALEGPWAPRKITELSTKERINKLLHDHKVLLFMKGTPAAPRCGFSSRVAAALQEVGQAYNAVDILAPEEQELREVLKEVAEWPTYPMLFVKGELMGGCDIVTDLQKQGKLKSTLEEMLGA